MPRKGSGQKIQTAKGQAYGEAQMQEEAQRQMPLPQMPSAAKASPGQSSLNRSTERPNEALAAAAGPPPQRTFEGVSNEALFAQLPQPYASDQTKAFVRQLRMVAQRNGAM
jgi:hypothetical protein